MLSIAVSGNVRGAIDAGRVFRLQALGPATATVPTGIISSNITTYVPRSKDDFRDDAIVMIVAGNGITWTFQATGAVFELDGVTLKQASIGIVAVGPLTCASGVCPIGIQGNILAPDGHIGYVYSTGPIGRAATAGDPGLVNIWAGAGVNEVRAVREEEAWLESTHPQIAQTVDFRADIKADWGYPNRPGLGRTTNGAVLRMVQTAGNYYGSISAGNMAGVARFLRDPITHEILREPNGDPRVNTNFHSGVLLGGQMNGPITIQYKLFKVDLMASNFPQPITIGLNA